MPALPVTIVSTVLNEIQRLPRLVESLLALDPAPAEIVIVDGGSVDGTWEWLERTQREHPVVHAIRDETCSLKHSAGPIARGRNVAIAAAATELIACADAGCTYRSDWLERLTAPLCAGEAQYVLGGSSLGLEGATAWDLASAPYFGVKLNPAAPSKSCTARSMAFTRALWKQVGGFPESAFFGEDTLFDLSMRAATTPAFPEGAKAFYRPRYTFRSACYQFAGYSRSDGILGVRPMRLARNAARCAGELAALAALVWTWIPLAVVAVLALHFAYAPDGRMLFRRGPRAVLARLAFSLLVPWLITYGHLRGMLIKEHPVNRQNRTSRAAR